MKFLKINISGNNTQQISKLFLILVDTILNFNFSKFFRQRLKILVIRIENLDFEEKKNYNFLFLYR